MLLQVDLPSFPSNRLKRKKRRDLSGGPVVKRLCLPLQGVWVQSLALVRELGSHVP